MSDEKVVLLNGEKKECPNCHKMVSARPGPFAVHLKKCKAVNVEKSNAQPPVNVEQAQQEVKKTVVTNVDLSKISNAEVRKHMERAAAVQAELRKAPEIFVGAMNDNATKTLVAAYAPECVASYDTEGRSINTHTPYWGDARQITADIARGYEPVLNEQSDFVRNHGGDILYRIPRQISQARIRKSEQASEARLSWVTKMAAQSQTYDANGKPVAMPEADMSGIKEEAFGKVSEMTFTSNEGLG